MTDQVVAATLRHVAGAWQDWKDDGVALSFAEHLIMRAARLAGDTRPLDVIVRAWHELPDRGEEAARREAEQLDPVGTASLAASLAQSEDQITKAVERLSEIQKQATPGPWRSDGDECPHDVSIWGPGENTFLGNVGGSRMQEIMVAFDVDVPNGKLMSLAPELAAVFVAAALLSKANKALSDKSPDIDEVARSNLLVDVLLAEEKLDAALNRAAEKVMQ